MKNSKQKLEGVNLLEKKIRAKVIKEYLVARGEDSCVCLTSGNSAKYLRKEGIKVIEIGRYGLVDANRWLSFNEVGIFNKFDATSGHLPLPMMVEIGKRLKDKIGKLRGEYLVNAGSGETVICLKLAYPDVKFTAVYNVKGLEEETRYSEEAPLNGLVKLLCDVIIGNNK